MRIGGISYGKAFQATELPLDKSTSTIKQSQKNEEITPKYAEQCEDIRIKKRKLVDEYLSENSKQIESYMDSDQLPVDFQGFILVNTKFMFCFQRYWLRA